jgi:Bacterial mobilisation protein (MobC)
MGRRARQDAAERYTVKKTLQLTPSQDHELEAAAASQGATLSAYTRELLFRRSADVIAGTRRNPEAAAVMRALDDLGHDLRANGNNLNQIARHLNISGMLQDADPALLQFALERHAEVLEQVKLALSAVLDL